MYFILFVCTAAIALGTYFAISYDESTTHPALTYEVIELYNRSFPNNPISKLI